MSVLGRSVYQFDTFTLRIMMGKVVHTKRRPYPAVSGVPGFVIGQGSVFMLYNEPQSDLVHRPCCPPHTPKVRETSYILISVTNWKIMFWSSRR